MAIIAIQYEYDATKLDTIAENRPLHRAHLKELKEAGKLLASGPLGRNGALLVVVADEHVGRPDGGEGRVAADADAGVVRQGDDGHVGVRVLDWTP